MTPHEKERKLAAFERFKKLPKDARRSLMREIGLNVRKENFVEDNETWMNLWIRHRKVRHFFDFEKALYEAEVRLWGEYYNEVPMVSLPLLATEERNAA